MEGRIPNIFQGHTYRILVGGPGQNNNTDQGKTTMHMFRDCLWRAGCQRHDCVRRFHPPSRANILLKFAADVFAQRVPFVLFKLAVAFLVRCVFFQRRRQTPISYIEKCACTYIYAHTHKHVHIYISTCVHRYMHMHIHKCMRTHALTLHMRLHIRMHVRTHVHTHARTHTPPTSI
jgi:hypothetical protein